jgi:hypothetical protein
MLARLPSSPRATAFSACASGSPSRASRASRAASIGPSHAAKPGIGDSVQNTLRRGSSCDSTSTTFFMRKLPSGTPRRPGWQLLIE